MKRFIYAITILTALTSCDDFLDNKPKGTYNEGNYDMSGGQELLVISTLFDGYNTFKEQTWPVTAMHCHTTDNSHAGGPAGDGGTDFCQFPTMSFTAANSMFTAYYGSHYTAITKANEALAMLATMETDANMYQLIAEAYFIRSAAYFRLTQAFGPVPYVDRVMDKNEAVADQLGVSEIRTRYLKDLIWAVDYLPTRQEMVSTGNLGRATQNAARAIIAKTYLYEGNYAACMDWCGQIIQSGDNDLSTAYSDIWLEHNEFGPESIWEINCDYKPDQKIDMWCQWNMMNGVRGLPNLGYGHNAPSADLMAAYETGDPRYSATVMEDGQIIDGDQIKASDYKYFNKKTYCPKSERSLYGREDWCYGYWANLRIIRYADILLMYAEAACELNKIDEAKVKLEMVRARARGNNSPLTCLPEIKTDSQDELRATIRHERRIELALEFERFFDLVRWNEAKNRISGFVTGKHELFPIPQSEIDKAGGKLHQNPGY